MKSTKNIFLSVTLYASCIIQASPFELYNKANQTIGVTIHEIGYHRLAYTIEPKGQLALDLNFAHTFYIAIIEGETIREFSIKPLGKRTMYLTWNSAKAPYLYPQTGPLLGFKKETVSGLPLDKETNVDQSQIETVR